MKQTLPGGTMTPFGIFLLGQSYEEAGHAVVEHHRNPFSDHPARFVFLHAIEMYLRSYLRLQGCMPEDLRAYLHDITRMSEDAIAKGMILGERVATYIAAAGVERDYVKVRYAFDLRVLSSDWPPTPSPRPRKIEHLVAATAGVRVAVRDALRGTGIEIYDPLA